MAGLHGCVSARAVDGMVVGSFELPENTSAARFLLNLSRPADPPTVDPRRCLTWGDGTPADPVPLTVVIRTQGKRIEELSDVLLCLFAQTVDDFEIVVVGHRVPIDERPALEGLIGSFPVQLTRRIRLYYLDEGNRTTPLRHGFALARGSYVTVLDDDDLVMDTWAECFAGLAKEHEGAILYAYTVTQEWGVIEASREGGCHELVSEGPFVADYCRDFDAAAQLTMNARPLMSLAFPRFVFQDMGVDFDETLTTTEDWDFLMRAYPICGIAGSEQMTSIYRLWKNIATSHSLHSEREWEDNYARIIDRLNGAPYLFDSGAVEDIREKSHAALASRGSLVRASRLFVNGGGLGYIDCWDDVVSYHEGRYDRVVSACFKPSFGEGEWDLSFDLTASGETKTLFFSPTASAFKVMCEFKMRLSEQDGTCTELDFASCVHNGYQVDCNHIVFLKPNPFVRFELPRPMRLATVDLAFQFMTAVPDYYVDQIAMGKKGLMIGRARRWLSRKIHGRG